MAIHILSKMVIIFICNYQSKKWKLGTEWHSATGAK